MHAGANCVIAHERASLRLVTHRMRSLRAGTLTRSAFKSKNSLRAHTVGIMNGTHRPCFEKVRASQTSVGRQYAIGATRNGTLRTKPAGDSSTMRSR